MDQTSPCYFTARDDGEYVVSYEIGNACNMDCLHCMNKSGKKAFPGLPTAQVKELLRELALEGVHYLYVSGGEPLVHPGFDEIIATAHRYGFQMMLATNGLEISNHLDVLEKYIGDVSISLDGIGKVHDEFRGTPGAFDQVMKSIELLHQRGIYARISTCLWKKSAPQLEQIIDLADRLHLGKVNLSILVPTGRATENDIHIPWNEYPDLLHRIEALQRKYRGNGHVEVVLRRNRPLDEHSIDCIGSSSIYHINAYGRISPCSWCSKSDVKDAFSMQWEPGNLHKCVEKSKKIITLLQQRKEKYGYTGCPAIAYFQNGDFGEPDPINQMLTGGK